MRNLSATLKVLISTAFILALASLAQAQATRTWVSGVGDDVNPCSRTAPCKTWAGAISKTAANGEIDALDPAGYGTLTATKSIMLDGQGTLASTLNSGGINGIVVNDSATATPGTIIVRIRNVSINGAGTTLGLNGIRFVSGKALHVENCVITNQSGDGILVNPSSANPVEVDIEDTTIQNVNGSGVNVSSGGAILNVSVDNSVLKDNGHGLTDNVGTANISRTLVTGNTTDGIRAISNQAVINATSNVVTNNGGSGISAVSGSVVRIDDNKVFRNGTGLTNNGTMETWQNNEVRGNTANVGGAIALTNIAPVGTGTQ
ncbi:MAG: right-handed parallel beta-helix repeat-containing protein [Pyrinomonadaceae bacterium]|nr:right-handed parallel beta-helix repeat-containing protein [Pyrinomonadaceae bacterium]